MLFATTSLAWSFAGGALSGGLKGPAGDAIPGAKLTLVNSGLRTEFSITTDAQAFYSFPSIPVGRYDMTDCRHALLHQRHESSDVGGTPSTFTITATGNPLPSITLVTPLPPLGFSFQESSPGSATITYDGLGLTPTGNYPVVLQAGTLTFMAGAPFTYTVTVAGSPRPTLSCDLTSALQGQVTFTDNGNGTGTFAGTLAAPLVGGGGLSPFCNLVATNGSTSAQQQFLFNATVAPAATITSATTATFADLTTGAQPTGTNGLPIKTSGAQTPVSFTFPCGDQPFWLTVTNNGDGTGVISGNPPAGITSSSFTLVANAAGSNPPAPQCSTPTTPSSRK
jgi:hypothetical protein